MMYSFPNLESVCCSMSRSNCCFLTCIQISQRAGQVVWYSHLFFDDPVDVGSLISGSSAFSKTNLNIWKFTVNALLKPGLENFDFQPRPLFFPVSFIPLLFLCCFFLVPALLLFCNILPIPLVFVFLIILSNIPFSSSSLFTLAPFLWLRYVCFAFPLVCVLQLSQHFSFLTPVNWHHLSFWANWKK